MTHESAKQILSIAYEISNELAKVEGVVAIVIGGSWAKSTAKPDSDIDLAMYYEPRNLPSLEHLRRVANQFDDSLSQDILTDFGGWGHGSMAVAGFHVKSNV